MCRGFFLVIFSNCVQSYNDGNDITPGLIGTIGFLFLLFEHLKPESAVMFQFSSSKNLM